MKNWIPFFDFLLRFIFGSKQQRDLNELRPVVDLVNMLECTVHNREDVWFKHRADDFRSQLNDGVHPETVKKRIKEKIKEAHENLSDLDSQKAKTRLRDRLRSNRDELLEKYADDSFKKAVKKPLKDSSINSLVDSYAERISRWKDQSIDEVMDEFERLWSHFKEMAPDEDDKRNRWWLLPEAFSCVREVAHRRLGLRHYDVQTIGAVALHQGRIAEMKTGEGKTLAATMPLFLNALDQNGVHLITVNEYLATRDSEWMGEVYERLGLDVDVLKESDDTETRREAYQADIVYGTNSQFGFDYLRDHMATKPEETVQPSRDFSIIDEVDSVLIDEARTPLIISGPAEENIDIYKKVNRAVRQLESDQDYEVDEKKENTSLTDSGADKIEDAFGLDNLYDASNMELVHRIEQSIRAHELYEREEEYIVKDNEVVIVDEFTGRLQPGRRFGEGLHQALEAKENVSINQETQTFASITIQNFFLMYDKLSGMTGTADTEAEEFHEIYDLDVVVVPTHKPDIRVDKDDVIFRTEEAKFNAVVERIEKLHNEGQPVLVGTVDIDKSEKLGRMLGKRGIDANVLNAKNHEREAAIIAEAGQSGAVTIATNMAGRGTDIVLGDDVIEKGCPQESDDPNEKPYCPHEPTCGLHVIGTERHEARRIDNQLRGRTARQGEPGVSRFYLSLEDDLLRLFGSDKLDGYLESAGFEEDDQIEHSWITSAIERAQNKVESRNFEIRKNLLEYDDVMDRQRKIIYEQRRDALFSDDVSDTVFNFILKQVAVWIEEYGHDRRPARDWPIDELVDGIEAQINWTPDEELLEEWKDLSSDALRDELLKKVLDLYKKREEEIGTEQMRTVESQLYLSTIDTHWKEHLRALDHLKQSVQTAQMAKKKPLVEYKRRGFRMFEELQTAIREELLEKLFTIESAGPVEQQDELDVANTQHDDTMAMEDLAQQSARSQQKANQNKEQKQTTVVKDDEPGRNDPCPCGSGKKYKYCHGG